MSASPLNSLSSDKIYPLSRFTALTSKLYPFPIRSSYQNKLYLQFLNLYGHVTRLPNSRSYYYKAFTQSEAKEAAKLRHAIQNQISYYTKRQETNTNIKKLTQLQLQELHSFLLPKPIKTTKKRTSSKSKLVTDPFINTLLLKKLPYMKAIRYRIESLQREHPTNYFSLKVLSEAIFKKKDKALHFKNHESLYPKELLPFLDQAEMILNYTILNEISTIISRLDSSETTTTDYAYLLERSKILNLCTKSEKELIDNCFTKYKDSAQLIDKKEWAKIKQEINSQISPAHYCCKCYNFRFHNKIDWNKYNTKYDMSQIQNVINTHLLNNISKSIKQIKNPSTRKNISTVFSIWAEKQLGTGG